MVVKRVACALLAALLIVSLMGSSCKKKRKVKQEREYSDSLCEAAQDFNKLLIWRNISPASLMVVPPRRIDFLMDAEKYGGAVQIENFSILVGQASETPPVRDLNLPSTDVPDKGEDETPAEEGERRFMGKEEVMESVEKDPVPKTDKSLYEAGIERPKAKKPKKEKIYYGTVLVRYINRNILPSATVDTKLITQYWICVGDVWYCDFEWTELIKP